MALAQLGWTACQAGRFRASQLGDRCHPDRDGALCRSFRVDLPAGCGSQRLPGSLDVRMHRRFGQSARNIGERCASSGKAFDERLSVWLLSLFEPSLPSAASPAVSSSDAVVGRPAWLLFRGG